MPCQGCHDIEVTDGRLRSASEGEACQEGGASIDELLDHAVAAINRGDRAAATALAGQVLAADSANAEAEDLLAAPSDPGEIRRLTIFFADLVDSTVLSTRVEPETYRLLVGRYREQVLRVVNRYEGHIGSTKGDGLLAVFGYPIAHEDDVRRAVHAALEITREVARLSVQAQRRFGIAINVRVGVHRGLVYLDTAQDDVYGLAANLAARVSGLAPPGAVVVSDAVAALIGNNFELEARPAALVKGVGEPITHYLVVAERTPSRKSGHGPLVGRDRELALLAQSWAQAQAGTLSTPGVVFRGEPGIGKSRLAVVAAQLVEASGSVVLELVGSPFHTDAGLYPVRTLLERQCGIDRSADQGQRLRLLDAEICARGLDPRSTVPLLAPVLGIDAAAGYEQVAAEGRKLYELIAQEVQTYLLACMGGGPALVVSEDVHWFDPSTREVLGALLNCGGGRLLAVITGRPGEWLSDNWPHKVFDLTTLTDEQTDALITALNPNLNADERAQVSERCDGVPFYIEQVANGVGQSGVPEPLYEPLFARLRASPKVVPVVEAAAVIGRQIDRDLLNSVVDLSDDEVDDVIDELEDALVLEPCGTGNWRFRHELLREVAAELAPPTVQRGLHAKVADVLSGGAGGEPDWGLVAGHYERAHRFDQAAAAYQQASHNARLRGALAEALACLTRGLAQLDRATPGPDRDRRETALRMDRGFLTSAAEGYQSREAAADFERCLRLGGTLRDDELFATLIALGNYYQVRADLRRAAQAIESLRRGLEGRQWARPKVDVLIGTMAFLRGDLNAATSALEAATAGVATADQHKVDAEWLRVSEPISSGCLHLALVALVRGDLTKAEAELARSARLAEGFGFPEGPYLRAYIRSMETWLRVEAGQLDRAALVAADMINEGERHGFDMWRLVGAHWQAIVGALAALDADDLDPTDLGAHIATITAFLDSLRTIEVNIYTTLYDGVLGRLLIAAGQPEAARERLDTALALAQDTGMCFYDAELLRLRAQTYDDPAARQAEINAALDLARCQGATLFELRAALDDYELRGEPARARIAAAVSHMSTDSTMFELARARAAMDLTNRE
jgi:class 3 adenylate cyclase/tetratricopeptide (TPR) repeat protein